MNTSAAWALHADDLDVPSWYADCFDETVEEEPAADVPLTLEPLESPLSRVMALTYPDYHRLIELPNMEFQGEASDCWVCCVAMLTGDAYNDVYDAGLPFYEAGGVTFMNLLTIMRRLGHRIRWHHPERFDLAKQGAWLRQKVRGVDAIHLVPSLRNYRQSGAHYVAVINGVVYDPTWFTPYSNYEDLHSMGAVYLA